MYIHTNRIVIGSHETDQCPFFYIQKVSVFFFFFFFFFQPAFDEISVKAEIFFHIVVVTYGLCLKISRGINIWDLLSLLMLSLDGAVTSFLSSYTYIQNFEGQALFVCINLYENFRTKSRGVNHWDHHFARWKKKIKKKVEKSRSWHMWWSYWKFLLKITSLQVIYGSG